MNLWLIGISGAGKTTVGKLVTEGLREQGRTVLFLDGDDLREVWSDDLGHSIDARRKNHMRISKLCRTLDQGNIDILVSALSIFPDLRKWNHENLSDYVEICLDLPIEEATRRDPKAIYARRAAGELNDVAGIDFPFPHSETTSLIISPPDVLAPPQEIADRILSFLNSRGEKTSHYPYTGRDLFSTPESYEFADCRDHVFFTNWRRHRQVMQHMLHSVAFDSRRATLPANDAALPESIPDSGKLIWIMDAIACIAANNDTPETSVTKCKVVLDEFVKKFEIFRRLFNAYDVGYARTEGADLASTEDYISFGRALVAFNDRTNIPIYASTLLKLMDALLSIADTIQNPDIAYQLLSLLKEEGRIVMAWEQHVEYTKKNSMGQNRV
jgi:adenylylsulfate kinase